MAEIEVTQSDNGTSLQASVGDTLSVRLPENPTTGYRWQQDSATEGIIAVGDAFTPSSTSPGAGGTRLLRFSLDAAEGLPLRLSLRRAWEDSTRSPQETFELHLVIE